MLKTSILHTFGILAMGINHAIRALFACSFSIQPHIHNHDDKSVFVYCKRTDVAGLDEAKAILYEAVILPLAVPDLFNTRIRQPWKVKNYSLLGNSLLLKDVLHKFYL